MKTFKFCAVVLLCASSANVWSQSSPKASNPDASLYSPIFQGKITINAIPHDIHAANFTLMTSWIPGPTNKGILRFKVHGWVEERPHTQTEAVADGHGNFVESDSGTIYNDGIPLYLQQLRSCMFDLLMYDDAGFKLREIPLVFVGGVDGVTALLTSLDANDSVPMSAEEYRHSIKGSWNIEWSGCP